MDERRSMAQHGAAAGYVIDMARIFVPGIKIPHREAGLACPDASRARF
jgi:hypothetical protein